MWREARTARAGDAKGSACKPNRGLQDVGESPSLRQLHKSPIRGFFICAGKRARHCRIDRACPPRSECTLLNSSTTVSVSFRIAWREAPTSMARAFSFSLVLVVAAAPLAACASSSTPVSRWRPVTSLLGQRQSQAVIQQWDLRCGAAVMASLLNSPHGKTVSKKAIAASMLRRAHPLTVRVQGRFAPRPGLTPTSQDLRTGSSLRSGADGRAGILECWRLAASGANEESRSRCRQWTS